MRGTQQCESSCSSHTGIIPAYAGNTATSSWRPLQWRDHPRVCGEHRHASNTPVRQTGSSPRMRGTPYTCVSVSGNAGIIPAYAGNTRNILRHSTLTRDHPRVCGEHNCDDGDKRTNWGSSPRMRGTPLSIWTRQYPPRDHPRVCGEHPTRKAWALVWTGIIPAYAGNTWMPPTETIKAWDHPRVCGEHAVPSDETTAKTGSSPRMRGTH